MGRSVWCGRFRKRGKRNMAAAKNMMMQTRIGSMNQIPISRNSNNNNNFSLQLLQVKAGSRNNNEHSFNLQNEKIRKKGQKKTKRALISISTAGEQRWDCRWRCEYVFTLQDLRLVDLVELDKDARVHVSLSIQQHASFGLSVEGRIVASLAGKYCTNCSLPYSQQIDASFNVWVLGSDGDNSRGDVVVNDPSVIYVKPGCEANLDSLVQDTIRLNIISSKNTCSEACEKSGPTIQYVGRQYTASTKQRWQGLLKLRTPDPQNMYNDKDSRLTTSRIHHD